MSNKFDITNEEKNLMGENLQKFFDLWEDFKGKTDGEIGEILGVSKQTVGRYLKGEITFDLTHFLHKHYNLNVNWLFTGKGQPLCKS